MQIDQPTLITIRNSREKKGEKISTLSNIFTDLTFSFIFPFKLQDLQNSMHLFYFLPFSPHFFSVYPNKITKRGKIENAEIRTDPINVGGAAVDGGGVWK